jgi:tRNA nucleotidyltransferase (CCA-adding enzyme)
MSDYMFMLENHLTVEQNRVVAVAQAVASEANVSLFLTGGAMRDVMGGFPVRDLDFTVEGNSVKLAKTIAERLGAETLSTDDNRRSVELVSSGGVTFQIAMARQERYGRMGSRPQVSPATIQEDLRHRDFTCNAIALSLNRASRGLLIDPMNGLSEIVRKELRTLHSTAFYDDPSRLLRLIRLKVRLGYEIEERTKQQYQNAREAKAEAHIASRTLGVELKHLADEPNPAETVKALDEEKLLELFSPALAGPELNLAGLIKLDKARRLLTPDVESYGLNWGPFIHVLTENLNAKEKAALIQGVEMAKADVEAWQKLPARAKKLEAALKSAKLKKPSQIYNVLQVAPGTEVLFLLYQSPLRLVNDRIRNYFQRYLPLSQEITDAEVEASGVAPGNPKFAKVKAEMVAARVDGRTKKPPPPPVDLTPPPGPRGRRPVAVR